MFASMARRLLAVLLGCGFASVVSAQPTTQASIRFSNLGPGVNAPFFGTAQTNRLVGSNYLAALYIGEPADETLLGVGSPQPFQAGTLAGYWLPSTIVLPSRFAPGLKIRVQVRFWSAENGTLQTFEEAESSGADVGVSTIPELELNTDGSATDLVGLQPASLVPTITLTRGIPGVVTDASAMTGGSQFTNLCGVTVGLNRWFRVTSPEAGPAFLHTTGSTFDTVLSGFSGSIVSLDTLTPLACNDDRGPSQTSSAIHFPMEANKLYLVCLAGKNGASGAIMLTHVLASMLEIQQHPGAGLDLSWPADGVAYQVEATATPALPGSWRVLEELPFLENSRYHLPVNPAETEQKFFRLRLSP